MIKLIKPTDESAHPTVTEFIKLQTPDETIQIGFTDQKVSGRAGLVTFASFLHSARSARRPHARSDSVTATETTTRISFGVTMVDSSEVKLRRISHAAGLVAGFVLR